MHRPLPSREELLRWFSYDPGTGLLTRVRDPLGRRAYEGRVRDRTNGRQKVARVGGQDYLVSRLVWVIMTGEDPGEREVDHADLDPLNDRWANLRLADGSQNCANKGLRSDNKTGAKGVVRRGDRFQARLRARGREYWSERFDTLEEASAAYQALAEKHSGAFGRG